MKIYTKKIDDFGNDYVEMISENGVISIVPINESNADYQRYLRHLAGEDESGTLS